MDTLKPNRAIEWKVIVSLDTSKTAKAGLITAVQWYLWPVTDNHLTRHSTTYHQVTEGLLKDKFKVYVNSFYLSLLAQLTALQLHRSDNIQYMYTLLYFSNDHNSQGAYVAIWSPQGMSWRKQATYLDVLGRP